MENNYQTNLISFLNNLYSIGKIYKDLFIPQNNEFFCQKFYYLTEGLISSDKDITFNINSSSANILELFLKNESIEIMKVYLFAKSLIDNKEYLRCASLIKKHELQHYNIEFEILMLKSLYETKNYKEMVGYVNNEIWETSKINSDIMHYLLTSKYYFLALCYHKQENIDLAIEYYKKALLINPSNYICFSQLSEGYLLKEYELDDLIERLNFGSYGENSSKKEDTNEYVCNFPFLKDYYMSMYKDKIFITSVSDVVIDSNDDNDDNDENEGNLNDSKELNKNYINIMNELYLNSDIDLMRLEATMYHNINNYESSLNILYNLQNKDFYFTKYIPIICGSMLHMNKSKDLNIFCSRLNHSFPDEQFTFYAFGCYSLLTKNLELAKKSFLKCKSLPYALIALGLVHSLLDEMPSTEKVFRNGVYLFPGSHIFNLYLGMEYIKSNNLKYALLCLERAMDTSSKVPLIYNEIGAIYYKKGQFDTALEYFNEGIRLCLSDQSMEYQKLLINRSHVLRKKKNIEKALEGYEKVHRLDSSNFEAISNIGFCYHILGNYYKALDYYQKGNFMNSRDEFVKEMMEKCLVDLTNSEENMLLDEIVSES